MQIDAKYINMGSPYTKGGKSRPHGTRLTA